MQSIQRICSKKFNVTNNNVPLYSLNKKDDVGELKNNEHCYVSKVHENKQNLYDGKENNIINLKEL